jgi:hypothetical protein
MVIRIDLFIEQHIGISSLFTLSATETLVFKVLDVELGNQFIIKLVPLLSDLNVGVVMTGLC